MIKRRPFAWALLALFMITGCRPAEKADTIDLSPIRKAISEGRMDEARQLTAQGKQQATDSDTYYRYVALDARRHFSTMQADSFLASNHALEAYLQRHPMADHALRAECEMQKGVYEAKMVGRVDSAMRHFRKALPLLDEPCARLTALTNMADVSKQAGRYDESVDFYRQAMALGDSIGMTVETEIALANGIASAYASIGSFDQSALWWEKAERLRPQMQRDQQFHYLNNRGNDYYLQGRYEESLQCFLQLDSLLSLDPNMHWEQMFGRANLSDVYIKLGETDKALPLLDETEQFFSCQHLAVALYYLNTQRIELQMLEGHTEKALQLAATDEQQRVIPEQRLLRLKVLTRLYEQAGRWAESNRTLREMDYLHDSIASDQMRMRFQTVLTDYNHQKEILEKQQEVEAHKQSLRWALFLLVVTTLVIALLTVFAMLKRRERKLRETSMRFRINGLRMETVRNRITPHFIGNALSAEMMAQLEGKPVDLSPLVQLLHRGLEMTGVEQTTLADELEFIRFYCDIERRSVGDDFRLDIKIADAVDPSKVVLPSMMVQILVENAIKHGLKRRAPRQGHYRQVQVLASRQAERQGTLIEVIDNGLGLDTTHVKEHTGLMVMRKSVALLNEQNEQQMDYGLENYTHADGDTGCRAWLWLPDHYDYTMSRLWKTTSQK